MATYYVKNGGNDSADGLSDGNAWATLAKVKSEAQNEAKFVAGDSILFNRGDTWREGLGIDNRWCSGSAGSPIVYGAYGTGLRPKILGSYDLSATGNWADQTGNIWRCSSQTNEIANLIFNNEAFCGHRVATALELTTQGYFYYDATGDYVDVYSVGNPGTYYTHIEAAVAKWDWFGFDCNRSYNTCQDIDFRYWGIHGTFTYGSSGAVCKGVTIQRCNVTYCGGSLSGATRYGNGIEAGSWVDDYHVRYNTVGQIFDDGITSQSYDNDGWAWHRHYYHHNIVYSCGFAGDHMIYKGSTAPTIEDLHIDHNVLYNNGGGWSADNRMGMTSAGAGIRLSTVNPGVYETYPGTNCSIRNNIVHTSSLRHVDLTSSFDQLDGWTVNNNCYYPDGASAFRCYGAGYSFADWKTQTGQDANSTVSDPSFVDAAGLDFHLSSASSPCYDTGTDAGYSLPYLGTTWDMGVFEYDSPTILKHCPFRKA